MTIDGLRGLELGVKIKLNGYDIESRTPKNSDFSLFLMRRFIASHNLRCSHPNPIHFFFHGHDLVTSQCGVYCVRCCCFVVKCGGIFYSLRQCSWWRMSYVLTRFCQESPLSETCCHQSRADCEEPTDDMTWRTSTTEHHRHQGGGRCRRRRRRRSLKIHTAPTTRRHRRHRLSRNRRGHSRRRTGRDLGNVRLTSSPHGNRRRSSSFLSNSSGG